ncbi:MAG: hypothetical protein FWE54_06360 [Methanimicrococcus sp.]|nr:hypothetical protein [Methanimicrococcus sp.]
MLQKYVKPISFIMILLLIGVSFSPIVSAQANEFKQHELEYIINSSKILYEDSNEQIIVSESLNGEIFYSFIKRDDANPNRVYFSVFSETELLNLHNTISKKNAVSQNMKSNVLDLENVFSEEYLCSEETINTMLSLARASGFGTGSYAESYGNSLTGGVHIYLSPTDAPRLAAGSSALLSALGAALVLAAAMNMGISAVPGALLTLLGNLITIYYLMAKNNDGSLNIKVPYITLAFFCFGVPGGSLFISIGSIKYYI